MTQKFGLASDVKKQTLSKQKVLVVMAFILFLLLSGMLAGTQYAASKTNWHPALGQHLFTIDGNPVYAPWKLMLWKNILPFPLYASAIKLCLMVFMLPPVIFLIIAIGLKKNSKPKGLENLHGSARWAVLDEVRKIGLLDGKGVYVGGFYEKNKKCLHYLQHDGPEHILCFAPTRSGKGVGLILPTLYVWENSVICTDIKGENWALTAGYRQSKGHKVLRFDPLDYSDSSACFNPIEEIRLNTWRAISDTQNIAIMLVDPEGKGLNDHWSKTGYAFICGVILHLVVVTKHNKKRSANMRDVCMAIASIEGQDIQELFEEMLETDHAAYLNNCFASYPTALANAVHDFIASSAQEMRNKADNEASGVISTAQSNLSIYRDPVVNMNTSRCDFKLHDLMNNESPVSLYLVVPPSDDDRLQPVTRLIISMVMRRLVEEMKFEGGRSIAHYKHRLLMMLDEFPAMGKIPIMERSISYCAGYGIKLYLIVQDLEQLNAAYGDKNSIMSNCHIRISYAPNTFNTAKKLSELAGKTTVIQEKTSTSVSGGKKTISKSVQEIARDLLTPDECMRIPGIHKDEQGKVVPGDMLIFSAGSNPIYGKQMLYFKDPIFLSRAKIPAPAKSDTIIPSNAPTNAPLLAETNVLEADATQFKTITDYLED